MRNRVCVLALALLASLPDCRPGAIRAPIAPPSLRIEAKPDAPSAEHAWIAGDWTWDHGKEVWTWRPGYYAKRPDKAKSYHRGRWSQRGMTYVWSPGKWLF